MCTYSCINIICYLLPSLGSVLGAGHISTLDGFSYTFNGLGEYILLTSTQFQLQGRTSVTKKNGVDQSATAFTSVVAVQLVPASDIIEYRLNSAKTGIGKCDI